MKTRTIASLSNNEVSEFPLSYKSYGSPPEINMRNLNNHASTSKVEFNTTISCLGQHVADVIYYKVYDSNLVDCYNAILVQGLKDKGFNTSSMIILKSDIFDDTNIRCLTCGKPENAEAIRLRRFKNAVTSSMKLEKKKMRFVFIPIRKNDHWHFLMWYTDQNLYVHYDSNHKALGKENLEASLENDQFRRRRMLDIMEDYT
ncbi:hypothetical protein ZOSMA_45G00390 [Zostera marina]|uniref:Ubiquitin-like protease family profile domain-containing protein n=1 Tax=Zostera marina TaxID=29655 RepID=A0A0K9P0J0_ZOSMR|nr:hypothetical protein ZOSMA_45G00390 [Zostera marina]